MFGQDYKLCFVDGDTRIERGVTKVKFKGKYVIFHDMKGIRVMYRDKDLFSVGRHRD